MLKGKFLIYMLQIEAPETVGFRAPPQNGELSLVLSHDFCCELKSSPAGTLNAWNYEDAWLKFEYT